MGENGRVGDVIPGSPAGKAGVTSGARLIAVNGHRFSTEDFHDVLKASSKATAPIELILENDEYYTTARVDYHGGERYPHLERISGKIDLLETLGRPLAPSAMTAKK